MKIFTLREIDAAIKHAAAGHQALHVASGAFVGPHAPACFRRAKEFAHLFDQDELRLVKTARRLGVRVIKLERKQTSTQHIDLCGGPLNKAKSECTDQ